MRKLIIALLACGGMAILSAPAFAQSTEASIAAQQQRQETFCYRGAGAYCTSTSEHRYEACSNLAVDRGERRGGSGYDRFVYECLTGTIGIEPH
jgi:hypothetical protein